MRLRVKGVPACWNQRGQGLCTLDCVNWLNFSV